MTTLRSIRRPNGPDPAPASGAAAPKARLLARAIEIAAAHQVPLQRLGHLFDLLLRQTGACRVGLAADGDHPRIWVSLGDGEPRAVAEAFAERVAIAMAATRAERAAAHRPPVSVVRVTMAAPEREDGGPLTVVPLPGGRFFLAVDAGGPSRPNRRVVGELELLGAVAGLAAEAAEAAEGLAALRARDAERSRFVSTVAHELRTPLAGLAGYLDLLAREELAADHRREVVERSRRIVDGLAELVGDLLELARLEAGSLLLEREPFSVAEVTRRALVQLEPPARERQIRLLASLPPPLRMAEGDRRRTTQILTNLIGNAVKYAPPESTVEVVASVEGPFAVWKVRDEGPGISPEDVERIFQRFYRAPGQEEATGTGLGLPIARELARRMGGEVGVASQVGVGSTFVLLLPAAGTEATSDEVARRLGGVLEDEARTLQGRAGAPAVPSGSALHRRRPTLPVGSAIS